MVVFLNASYGERVYRVMPPMHDSVNAGDRVKGRISSPIPNMGGIGTSVLNAYITTPSAVPYTASSATPSAKEFSMTHMNSGYRDEDSMLLALLHHANHSTSKNLKSTHRQSVVCNDAYAIVRENVVQERLSEWIEISADLYPSEYDKMLIAYHLDIVLEHVDNFCKKHRQNIMNMTWDEGQPGPMDTDHIEPLGLIVPVDDPGSMEPTPCKSKTLRKYRSRVSEKYIYNLLTCWAKSQGAYPSTEAKNDIAFWLGLTRARVNNFCRNHRRRSGRSTVSI
jgi:hypothetical protein